jgi:predicted nucleotidyltransferase
MEPERIILFGSAARDEAGEESDIDLVVIAESDAGFFERVGQTISLYRGRRDVHALVYTPREWRGVLDERRDFAQTVVDEGQIVYERTAAGP